MKHICLNIVVEATDVVEGDGTVIGDTTTGGVMDEARMDVGRVEEVASAPWKKFFKWPNFSLT